MTIGLIITSALLFLIIATLYSSVGHAGASGYLAVMALLSFAPATIKPTSLILNIVVALIASVNFIRAGRFDRKIFTSFIVTAMPMAFIGGYISISPKYFKLVAGCFLLISAHLLVIKQYIKPPSESPREMPLQWGLVFGAMIGLVSGLIGVGGGIFLSPILLIGNWITVKNASGVAALFILFNSMAALAGHMTALYTIDYDMFYWIMAVLIGGIAGSYLGTIRFNNKIIITCLWIVLLSAGLKFVFVDFRN